MSREDTLIRSFTLLLVLATTLCGCATSGRPVPPKDEALLREGHGILAGSIGYFQVESTARLRMLVAGATIAVEFSRVDRDGTPPARFATTPEAWGTSGITRFSEHEGRMLFVRSLPAGTYRLTAYDCFIPEAWWNYTCHRLTALQANDFVLKPGQITYVGSHLFKLSVGTNRLGMPVPGTKAWFLSADDVEDDMHHLLHLRPELRALPLVDAMARQHPEPVPMD